MQRYAPGVMAQVVENRIRYGHLPEGTDPHRCIAVVDCAWLGEWACVMLPDGTVTRHLVCDCSAPEDRDRHLEKGLVVEVPFSYAQRHRFQVGPYVLPLDGPLAGVTVWAWEPGEFEREQAPY
jgi:hypothetical protein